MLKSISRWFAKWSKRFVDAATCFLRDPKRASTTAGIMFGALIVALYVVQVAAMFVPTTPVAATVLPLLSNQNLAMIALVAVIVVTSLGFDKVTITLPNGASGTLEDTRDQAVEALEKASDKLGDLADAVAPDKPS
ncbi:hypothetical protein ACLBV5_09860 [Brevundimonas sp. M1A4_2e]